MSQHQNLFVRQLTHRMEVIENAMNQVIDMNSLLHMEINLLKKRLATVENNGEAVEEPKKRDDVPTPNVGNGISASRSINL